MQQLVLGTAQLGLNYGINNSEGKPSVDEAYDILDAAYKNGIKLLDTAAAYGDSEKIIGDYMKDTNHRFNIITKLPKLNCSLNIEKQIEESLENSLKNLKASKVEHYWVHSFSDIVKFSQIVNTLYGFKNEGKIDNIGVSIYEVEELKYLIENLYTKVKVVQIPFNVFDLRWLKDGILDKAYEKGIQISVRSVFLQGLFFANKNKADSIHKNCYKYICELKDLCRKKNMDVQRIALDFIKEQKYIDYISIGCDTPEQLIKNVNNFKANTNFNEEDIKYIHRNFENIEDIIIDPRRWIA